MGIRNIDALKPIANAVQPLVTYDGRIISKPAEYDLNGDIIPDPSWVKFTEDMNEGKFEKK